MIRFGRLRELSFGQVQARGFLKLASCTFPQRLLSNPNCLKGDVAFCSSLRNVAVLILPAIKHC